MLLGSRRERVVAEIAAAHLAPFVQTQGRSLTREQAAAFLNQEGRTDDMWKHMMHAGEDTSSRARSTSSHVGRLGSHQLANDVDDILGASIYVRNGEKLGKIDDVIFDHDTMDIFYVVIDSGGWFESDKFLLPGDRISPNHEHKDDFTADATREQVKGSPKYDEKSLASKSAWKKFEDEIQEILG